MQERSVNRHFGLRIVASLVMTGTPRRSLRADSILHDSTRGSGKGAGGRLIVNSLSAHAKVHYIAYVYASVCLSVRLSVCLSICLCLFGHPTSYITTYQLLEFHGCYGRSVHHGHGHDSLGVPPQASTRQGGVLKYIAKGRLEEAVETNFETLGSFCFAKISELLSWI